VNNEGKQPWHYLAGAVFILSKNFSMHKKEFLHKYRRELLPMWGKVGRSGEFGDADVHRNL
jgi:hypothetical protein